MPHRFPRTRSADRVAKAIACVVLASLAVTAWHDVSQGWDVWSYHLPFASRLVGLTTPATYTFSPGNQSRFEGFPVFAELLQGILWRATGRVECVNFLSVASIPLVAWALRRWFAVPVGYPIVGLAAVPLVQTHAAASYVDLPSNAAAAVVWLLGYRAVCTRAISTRDLAIGGAFAAAAANMKFQLVPIVLTSAVPLLWLALKTKRWTVIAVFVPLLFFTPLKNLALHGNPVWPIRFLGFSFREGAYDSSPEWLAAYPRPFRFLCSLFEIGLRPVASHARWSLDQWTPPTDPGYRMGGFFGAYVVVNLIALVGAAVSEKSREARTAVLMFAVLTVVTSFVPQSHELRYYLVWMILLVALNTILWARRAPAITLVTACLALGVVTWSTEGYYLFPTGESFAAYLNHQVNQQAFATVHAGERVCVSSSPRTFLYAPLFHPEKSYSVQEGEEAGDCGPWRTVP